MHSEALVKEERFLYVNSYHPPHPTPQKKRLKDAENKPTPHSTTIHAEIKFGNHRAPKKRQAGRKGAGGREERARSQKFKRGR